MSRNSVSAAAFAAACFVAAPAWATVPIIGAVNATTFAAVGDDFRYDQQGDLWNTLAASLGPSLKTEVQDLQVVSEAGLGSGGNAARADASIQAHWNSADSGSVTVARGFSFDEADPDIDVDATVGGEGAPPDWRYVFRVNEDSVFNIAFDLGIDTNFDGEGQWDLSILDEAGIAREFDLVRAYDSDGRAKGAMSFDLKVGQNYEIWLSSTSSGGFSGGEDLHAFDREEGAFNWSIAEGVASGVPEPSTWALVVAGFGMVGAAIRARRSISSAA